MGDDIKLAWRNLWRNRRRTIITSSSILFAVLFAVVMRSYQLGSYDSMILNFIESYSGYLQVQHKKYQDSPIVDYSFDYSDSLASAIKQVENVVAVSPHIESFALASNGTQTKGVAVLAIDPEMEREFSNPENKLVRYRITGESISLAIFRTAIIVSAFHTQNDGTAYPPERAFSRRLIIGTNFIFFISFLIIVR